MDFEAARAQMVENQIRTVDVTSHSVLKAFLSVPREAFVPQSSQMLAYTDKDIELRGEDRIRYMSQPGNLAKLLQLAAVTKTDTVLDIACGSGYTAALLSLLAGSVVALESDAGLAQQAKDNLSAQGCHNVTVQSGDLEKGYAGAGPYSLILLEGAVEEIPAVILNQLQDGGRLLAVRGHGNAARATLVVRDGPHFSENAYFNLALKPLSGFEKKREFVF